MFSMQTKLEQKYYGTIYRRSARFSNQPPLSPSPSPDQQQPQPFTGRVPAFPITPPVTETDKDFSSDPDAILPIATHVLETEARALVALSQLYATDGICRSGFTRAVDAIVKSQNNNGKTIVIGVGKSGKVGDKFVASMNSLGILTTLLNPTDALHGDLGIIKKNDVFLLITFSGKTPELLQLLPYLPPQHPLIALTSHTSYHTSPLTRGRDNAILLPAPIPESETASFGLSAPTTSTTVAMALGDALALATASRLYNAEGNGPREVFQKNHPGGAIGQANNTALVSANHNPSNSPKQPRMRDLSVAWDEIPMVEVFPSGTCSPAMSEMSSSESDLDLAEWNPALTPASTEHGAARGTKGVKVLDALRLAVKSLSGWLQTANGGLIPPKKLMMVENVMADIHDHATDLVINVHEQLKVPADALVCDVARAICAKMARGDMTEESVITVIDGRKIVGVVEVATVIEKAGLL